jgi:hypothetical protein
MFACIMKAWPIAGTLAALFCYGAMTKADNVTLFGDMRYLAK